MIVVKTVARFIIPLLEKGDLVYIIYRKYQDEFWHPDVHDKDDWEQIVLNTDNTTIDKLSDDYYKIIKLLFKWNLG